MPKLSFKPLLSASFFITAVQMVDMSFSGIRKELMRGDEFKARMNDLRRSGENVTDANAEHYLEIYTESPTTGNESRPGHSAASYIKIVEDKPKVITHTSYMPGALSIISGICLGFVPVPSRNFPVSIRDDDVQKAQNHGSIVRIPISEQQFNAGVAQQNKIERRTNESINMYAITGSANPVASFITALVSSYRGAMIRSQNFEKEYGFKPAEDHLGIELSKDSHHPKEFERSRLLNCTAAVQEVIEKGLGVQFNENYVMPTSLAEAAARLPRASIVSESLVPSVVQPDKDTNIPEP